MATCGSVCWTTCTVFGGGATDSASATSSLTSTGAKTGCRPAE
jgi:hypothetical protein